MDPYYLSHIRRLSPPKGGLVRMRHIKMLTSRLTQINLDRGCHTALINHTRSKMLRFLILLEIIISLGATSSLVPALGLRNLALNGQIWFEQSPMRSNDALSH